LISLAIVIWGCARRLHQPASPAASAPTPPTACGALLSTHIAHVYHADRLHTIEHCKLVTGIVEQVRSERDGDFHIRLRLDPGQELLTNHGNQERQGGDLVVEPICEHPVTQEDAVDACRDFSGGVPRPHKGMHVRVIGPYVLDVEHGWMEIHPAVLIEELD